MTGAASGAASGAAMGTAIAPGLGTAIGAIGGAAIGAFSANAQSKKSYKYAKKLQAHAAKLNYQYSLKSAENLPTSTRTGLENAGYNPMLAVQNATSGANSSWTSATKADVADMGSAMSAGIANAQSVQRLKNETMQAESATDSYYANADKAKAEKAEISARLPFVSKRQRAEIANLEADAQLAEAQKHNLKERIELERYINDSGLAVTRRGQDMVYNASTLTPSKYLIDKAEGIYSSLGRPKTPRELGSGIANYYYKRSKR